MAASEEVRARQAHVRKARATGTAAADAAMRLEAHTLDRDDGVVDHLGMIFEHDLHVAVLLADLESVARAGPGRDHVLRAPLEQRFLGCEARLLEIADDESDPGARHRARQL